ncbi:MAG: HAMP domain-containing sensor histidine kinase [Thermodesulfobacteriota bacterium]|nr:HAMP domain-containing sensor histidine kinase [Thermodesulfobacteriota bacterium]
MMTRLKWLLHPILIFIFSIIALGLSLFLYIYWYIEVSTGLNDLITRFNLDPDQVLESHTWIVILVLSILVGIILVGIFITFIYYQKVMQLYRLQHNFINNFTHELKTPVTSLKLYLETFLKHDLSEQDRKKYISYMIQDVGRLSGNINSILNLARIESKNYVGEFLETDVVSAVKQFYIDNDYLFQECEILIHDLPGLSSKFKIDRPLFEMLLMNLTTNAIKYNESETPRLDISFEKKDKGVTIRFTDNGIGIGKKEIKRIFRKFYQAGRSYDMSAKGSGLGLNLVQNIVRIHKWKIRAESNPGSAGSVFIIDMPVKV